MSVISRSCSARVELVEPAQIHWLLQQRHNIRVESLPVGILSQLLVVNWEFGVSTRKFHSRPMNLAWLHALVQRIFRRSSTYLKMILLAL